MEVFLDWSFSLILFLNLSFRIYENLFFLFLSFLLFFEKSNSSLRTGLNWKFFFAILSYKFYYIFLMSKSICFIVKYPFSKRYVFFFFIYKIQITNSSTFFIFLRSLKFKIIKTINVHLCSIICRPCHRLVQNTLP